MKITFEDAVRLAMERGLDLNALCTKHRFKSSRNPIGYNIYQLIFGTPFINVLVGGGFLCQCVEEDSCMSAKTCTAMSTKDRECYVDMNDILAADYHLTQMLKIRMDIEGLKQYIIDLLNRGGE